MTINPMQLVSMIKSGSNPEQLLISIMLQRMGNNPFMSNLISLAQLNKTGDLETIARNMLSELGYNFDDEFKSFKDKFGF